jgi:hypothetical protein
MGEKPDQIERHIQHTRSELEENISELEEKVKSAFDWRTQFAERPALMLGAAFVGGAVLSALLASTSSTTSKVSSKRRTPSSDPWTPYTNREAPYKSRETAAHVESPSTGSSYSSGYSASKFSETWENLKNAAVGMATTRISEFIEGLVPGFTEHYRKAASGRPTTPFSSMPSSGGPSGGSGSNEKSWQRPNGGSDYASHS